MREIVIQASGCHDCELADCEGWCVWSNNYIDYYSDRKTFHPNCPMKEVKEAHDEPK